MKLLLGMTLLALITGIHSQFAPSAEDIACVGQYIAENPDDEAVLNVVNNCQEDACGNEDCLSGLTTLYSRCNSNYDLRASCNFVTPSLIQLVCINTTSTQRREEIDAKCGTIDTSSSDIFLQICAGGEDCVELIGEIYESCGYSSNFEMFCDGAPKVLAVPVLVLLFAVLSMLF